MSEEGSGSRAYVGKDFVHQGCGLVLDPEVAWRRLEKAARKNILRSQKQPIRFRRSHDSADLELLRSIWFDPADPNFPETLHHDDVLIIATGPDLVEPAGSDDVLLGVCLLLPVGHHLFLNNLAASTAGRSVCIQEALLWHCVENLHGQFDYIDVGVSFRPSLYRFFRKFQTLSYPVIFNPPAVPPVIASRPVGFAHQLDRRSGSVSDGAVAVTRLTQRRPATFVPDAASARVLLSAYGLAATDLTLDTPELSADATGVVDLTRVFGVAYGALALGIAVDDEMLWEDHGLLDVYKRELVYRQIGPEIERLDEIVSRRDQLWSRLAELFALDRLTPHPAVTLLKEYFVIDTGHDDRYEARLKRFGLEIERTAQGIALPVHQGLSLDEVDYMYAIFRGVLNHCSEWAKGPVRASFA